MHVKAQAERSRGFGIRIKIDGQDVSTSAFEADDKEHGGWVDRYFGQPGNRLRHEADGLGHYRQFGKVEIIALP